MDAITMLTLHLGAKGLATKTATATPEPEFTRFQFPNRSTAAVRAAALAPANTSRAPRTLESLGVPRELARELEGSLRALGHTKGERVTGFTFRADDGASYALKTSKPSALPGAGAGDLAA